jgi:D-3-phosphoglycerate dehydrogenase
MTKPRITVFEAIHHSGLALLQIDCDVHFAYGSSRDEIIDRSRESDIIIIKSAVNVDVELIDSSPNLKVIARAGTGLDNIDVMYAQSQGKQVLSVPAGNTVSAAEFAIMQMLLLCRRIPEVYRAIDNRDFRRHLLEGRELQFMNVGLVGLGNVGIEVARRLKGFKSKIVAYDPWSRHIDEFQSMGGLMAGSLNELTRFADIISLHTILTATTRHLVNDQFFEQVKPGLLLVNTARGGVISEDSVLRALAIGKLSFYATDLISPEPPFDLPPEKNHFTHPFLTHPRIITTPHMAASTTEAQSRISIDLAQQILKIF